MGFQMLTILPYLVRLRIVSRPQRAGTGAILCQPASGHINAFAKHAGRFLLSISSLGPQCSCWFCARHSGFLAKGMRILSQRARNHNNPLVIQVSLDIEKIPGRGEDAEPILSISRNGGGLLGVFDGLGGAGGVVYEHNGTVYSGAYHASRIARQVVLNEFSNMHDQIETGDQEFAQQLADSLRRALSNELTKKLAEIDKNPTKLKSTLIRRLPTTLTLLHFMHVKDCLHCLTIWAGDSRGYILGPTTGLQQLTRDDLKSEVDALDNLTDDSPLSNFVNADVSFELHSQFHTVTKPTVLFVASDGCFGYLPTPMHFERFLLKTLGEAKDETDWQQKLTDGFSGMVHE